MTHGDALPKLNPAFFLCISMLGLCRAAACIKLLHSCPYLAVKPSVPVSCRGMEMDQATISAQSLFTETRGAYSRSGTSFLMTLSCRCNSANTRSFPPPFLELAPAARWFHRVPVLHPLFALVIHAPALPGHCCCAVCHGCLPQRSLPPDSVC